MPSLATILVVDDEAEVRTLVSRVLEMNGYRALTAASGADALEIWDKSECRIDLLLTDLVMPDAIGGRELAGLLLAKKPGLKVIFTTGYVASHPNQNVPPDEQFTLLQKPYAMTELLAVIQAKLAEP